MTGFFFQEISTATNIPKLELDCVLRSLVLGTSFRKVLKKEPQEMELDGSVFFVNDHDFKSNRYKWVIRSGHLVIFTIYLNIIILFFRAKLMIPDFPFEYEIEKKPGVPNTVEEDRKRLIEASIVRTLKSKKEWKVRPIDK